MRTAVLLDGRTFRSLFLAGHAWQGPTRVQSSRNAFEADHQSNFIRSFPTSLGVEYGPPRGSEESQE